MQAMQSQLPDGADSSEYYDQYPRHWETIGFSMSMGGGLDVASTQRSQYASPTSTTRIPGSAI